MKIKHFVILIVLASFGSIGYGFSIKKETLELGNKYIGLGTVGLFLVAMPLFLINESKGKKIKKYMLTQENIKRMQKKEKGKPENQ